MPWVRWACGLAVLGAVIAADKAVRAWHPGRCAAHPDLLFWATFAGFGAAIYVAKWGFDVPRIRFPP